MLELGNFDLICWYLNVGRLAHLLGLRESPYLVRNHLALEVDLKNRLVAWLKQSDIRTLEQQLIAGTLVTGSTFTVYRRFYCRGLPKLPNKSTLPKDAVAELYSKLDDLPGAKIIRVQYHPENLRSASAWAKLSGNTRVFVVGYVEKIDEGTIWARPFAIADIVIRGSGELGWPGLWADYGEIFIDQIENFAKVSKISPPKRRVAALEKLRTIPEKMIKNTFAAIIGEPVIFRDWGGEKSDLFSTYVRIDGKRIAAAFAFKGPARFEQLTPAGLGKQGDQIDRLFSEPADLMVLQHCHIITGAVRSMMRAYANQIGRPKVFCLIDGFDTLRVIKAYGLKADKEPPD